VSLAREARNVADYSHDLRCQDRPNTEDLGEHGAGSLHLNSDALVEFRYPPIKSAHVSHHLGGQPPADSSGWVLWSSATQQLGGGIGRELLPDRIEEEVPQEEYVEAVLRARVRSQTRSSRLSVSSLKISAWPSGPSSGWTEASRSFRRAARAVKVASSASFFRELPVESTLTREESLGGTSTTRSPAASSFCASGRPMPPPAPSTAQRRSGKRFFAQRSRVRTPFRLAAKVRCPTNSPCSSISTRRRSSPCGDRRRSLSPCLAPSFALGAAAVAHREAHRSAEARDDRVHAVQDALEALRVGRIAGCDLMRDSVPSARERAGFLEKVFTR
jgi:hypothetical protein